MKLSDISIQRPVLATVMSLILVLIGFVGLSKLSVREYPDIDPPIVSVTTVYLGASAEVIESTITEILEDELIGIQGIKTMTSTSKDETSSIIIEFQLERDVDTAANDVRDRVSRARGRLPDDIEEPIISKQDTDASAIMWIGLGGNKKFSNLQLTDYADRYIVDQIQTVSGVGRVIIGGAREYAMRLWLDPIKMAARNVTALEVESALQQNNVEIPSGRIEGEEREFVVRTLGELTLPEEFNRLIIKRTQGRPVYLSDIGHAEIGAKSERTFVRFNGEPAVGLGIVKQSKANTLEVAKAVKQKVEEIRPTIPEGMVMEPAYDSSKFIQKSVDEVIQSLLIAFALVVLVIFVFLGDIRATLIPSVSIPISLIATFSVMYFMGYTINIITLLALTLAIGLVVDDNIVVLENIYRRIEMGEPPLEAAFKGMKEIAFAVIATTVALVAVFLPIIFITGITGRLLTEFSIVLAVAVIISSFVALTLSPMMCSRLLKSKEENISKRTQKSESWQSRFKDWFDTNFEKINNKYNEWLPWAFNHKLLIFFPLIIMIAVCALIYVILPKEFLPLDDKSTVFTVIEAPNGSTLEYTDKAVRQAEKVYAAQPEVSRQFSVIALSQEGVGSVNKGMMFVGLNEPGERSQKQQEIVNRLIPPLQKIPEASIFPISLPSGPSRGSNSPIQMVLQGNDIEELVEVAERIKTRAIQGEVPGMVNVQTNLEITQPQLNIKINREKASELGVSVRNVARVLQIMTGGDTLSTFKVNSKRYDVVAQAPRKMRLTPDQLNTIFINADSTMGSINTISNARNPGNDEQYAQLIPITSVLDFEEVAVPPEIAHYNRLRSVTVSGSLIPMPQFSLGRALGVLKQVAEEEKAPDMTIEWSGDAREFFSASNATLFAFLLALAVVYLVLCAQFESYQDPLIVMMTVPMAICGAILTLFFFGFGAILINSYTPFLNAIPFIHDLVTVSFSLNVYSQIALILLIGLVTKNGILIVEFANQIREANPDKSVKECVMEAAQIRFRPILMTSICTIFGALPIAVGLGSGIDSRKPLGWVIVGGMLLSTLLTLYVIPIVYQLAKNPDKLREFFNDTVEALKFWKWRFKLPFKKAG